MTVSKSADAGALKPARPPRKENGEGAEEAAALQLDTSKVATFEGFAEQLGAVLEATWQRPNFDFLINPIPTLPWAWRSSP